MVDPNRGRPYFLSLSLST
uniref:Uncharacterized protein n=1 Tax=Solanum lycopersicum TaxID=4081 RepID=A0A3Q7H9J9_SOLLC